MNPALLQLLHAPPLERGSSLAIIREFVVDPRSFPYLVSASKTPFLWIERPLLGHLVRAYIRRDQDVDLIFQQVLSTVIDRGEKYSYGNILPYTEEGVQGALEYVSYFLGGGDAEIVNPIHQLLELLVPEGSTWAEASYLDFKEVRVPIAVAKWLPKDTAVVVPLDRGFLGDLHLFGKTSSAVVVHNPSRGIAVARGVQDGG